MNIGSVRMTERHLTNDPPTQTQIDEAVADVDEHIDEAFRTVDAGKARTIIGVSGTVTTMTALAMGLKEYDHTVVDGHRLSLEDAYAVDDKFLRMTRAERREYKTIHPAVSMWSAAALWSGAVCWRVSAKPPRPIMVKPSIRSLPANTVCWTALCSIMVAGCWLNSVSGKCLQRAEPLSKQPGGLFVGEGSGYAATAARSAATRKQCSGQEIAYNRKVGLRGEMVYAVDLKSIASACGFESHRRHLEIGLWPMPFLRLCRGLSPVASPTAPLVRGARSSLCGELIRPKQKAVRLCGVVTMYLMKRGIHMASRWTDVERVEQGALPTMLAQAVIAGTALTVGAIACSGFYLSMIGNVAALLPWATIVILIAVAFTYIVGFALLWCAEALTLRANDKLKPWLYGVVGLIGYGVWGMFVMSAMMNTLNQPLNGVVLSNGDVMALTVNYAVFGFIAFLLAQAYAPKSPPRRD